MEGARKSANPSPTPRQPLANLSPLCQPFLPTPLQPPLSVDPTHPFRDTGSRLLGKNVLARKVAERKFPELFEFSFRILPRILLRIFPNFSRTFRASFRGRRRSKKIHQKSPPFFNAKVQANTKKYSQNSSGEQAKNKMYWWGSPRGCAAAWRTCMASSSPSSRS